MIQISKIPDMIRSSSEVRGSGKKIGFVPTMGALHAGHQSLIRRAKEENDFVVVSIFVNPLQFGPSEDFARYPRDLRGDSEKIVQAGGDCLFTTTPEEMYPPGFSNYVVPDAMASLYEGVSRPGHFRGVLTVVLKLFQIVQPDRAYFGKKDAQQLALIASMVRNLRLPIQIVPCPIVRETDGLAMSSRNAYLADKERESALALSRSLRAADQVFRRGERDAAKLLSEARAVLEETQGVILDYLVLIDPESWKELSGKISRGQLLLAAKVGRTRLIDNWILGEEQG